MILLTLALLQAGYTPEVEAVMNRSRVRAERRREEARDAREGTPSVAPADRARAQAATTSLPLAPAVAAKLQACLDAAIGDPLAGIRFAQGWSVEQGGFSAEQCRGFALARAERWAEAAQAFDAGALEAQKEGSAGDAARLWGQAGNAELAGGKADKARDYFDAALGIGLPDTLARGEIFLDRARAMVALGQPDLARQNLDEALKTAGDDPLAWLLSATLARRQGDLARAAKDIAEARKRSPDDASVALEDGNIAILSNDAAAARVAWKRAETLSPGSPQAAAARDSLARLDAAGGESAATTAPGAAPAAAPTPTPTQATPQPSTPPSAVPLPR